jgi:hypothetical protein
LEIHWSKSISITEWTEFLSLLRIGGGKIGRNEPKRRGEGGNETRLSILLLTIILSLQSKLKQFTPFFIF